MTGERRTNGAGTSTPRRQVAPHWITCLLLQQFLVWPLVLVPVSALAHIDAAGAGAGGFLSGLRHPITGLDHVVAMVAVGLWGAQLGPPAMWLLPVVFPLVMAMGGVAGVVGVALPGIGLGIAFSAILLGGMVATEAKPPLWIAMLMVGAYAIFHGHAHGTVMPAFGVPILFASGFVVATGLLHVLGIVIGLLVRWPAGSRVVRGAGVTVALVGVYFVALHLKN